MKFSLRSLLVAVALSCSIAAVVRFQITNSALKQRLQSLELAHGIPTDGDIGADVTHQLRDHPGPVTVTNSVYDYGTDSFVVELRFRDPDTGNDLNSTFSLTHESTGHYTGKFDDERFFADVPEVDSLWLSVIASPRLSPGTY
ncbi:MAG: hypothetical protein AAF802_30885 [Planctomycetota bacterium]